MKLFSIITVVLNNKDGIEKTIQSVINQTYKNFEYIIIDGGSTDGTIDIINKYKGNIDVLISEKDSGIYDAMNKGIMNSSGNYLLFLNSDDYLSDNLVLEDVNKELRENHDLIIGNAIALNENGKNIKYIEACKPIRKDLHKKAFSHQATFMKRKLFETVGYYNQNNKYASDLEWFYKYSILFDNTLVVDRLISYVSLGGVSSRGMFKANYDYFKVRLKYSNDYFTKLNLLLGFGIYVGLRIIGIVKLKRWFWKKMGWL